MAALFLIAFAAGAGAIACWIDVRFAAIAPPSLWGRIGASVAAAFVLDFARIFNSTPLAEYLSLFGIMLPAVVFALLTALWLLRALRDAQLSTS
jgi:hypothetical protein